MIVIAIIFWSLLFVVFYTYAGYGIVLYTLVKLKETFGNHKEKYNLSYEPEVTLFIAAYNEKDYIDAKIKNSLELDYPQDKLKMIWVTDGSDDGTPELLSKYPRVTVYHESARNGKIGAMNRGMKYVISPIVVFSDANTVLGKESIRRIVKLLSDPTVGCVSGEKRIFDKEKDSAAGAGEGFYWKYESFLKKLDFRLYSVVGAAGELFAIRTELFQEVEKDNKILC
jgi:cellulose synthase/poly-beta-1,6-N-acetylglucosamine synthase-like glycosyltransferase